MRLTPLPIKQKVIHQDDLLFDMAIIVAKLFCSTRACPVAHSSSIIQIKQDSLDIGYSHIVCFGYVFC